MADTGAALCVTGIVVRFLQVIAHYSMTYWPWYSSAIFSATSYLNKNGFVKVVPLRKSRFEIGNISRWFEHIWRLPPQNKQRHVPITVSSVGASSQRHTVRLAVSKQQQTSRCRSRSTGAIVRNERRVAGARPAGSTRRAVTQVQYECLTVYELFHHVTKIDHSLAPAGPNLY